jgi:hypothetical protein
VKLDGKSVKWSRGRVDVVIDDGDVDWGEVQVDPALFKQ